MVPKADMSNVIEGAIDIDFFEVLTIDIELTIFESFWFGILMHNFCKFQTRA